MPKFRVHGRVVGTKYIGEYEAATAADAEALAWRDAHSSMCHQCSSECEDAEIDELVVEQVEEPATA